MTWFNANICRTASVCLPNKLVFSRVPFIVWLSFKLYFEYKNMRATFVANKIISFLFLILISRINANQILGGKYVHFWVWSLLFLCWMKKMHSSPIYFMITWKFVRLCDILFMNLKRLQKGKVNIMHLCNWTCINYSTYHEIKKLYNSYKPDSEFCAF